MECTHYKSPVNKETNRIVNHQKSLKHKKPSDENRLKGST